MKDFGHNDVFRIKIGHTEAEILEVLQLVPVWGSCPCLGPTLYEEPVYIMKNNYYIGPKDFKRKTIIIEKKYNGLYYEERVYIMKNMFIL